MCGIHLTCFARSQMKVQACNHTACSRRQLTKDRLPAASPAPPTQALAITLYNPRDQSSDLPFPPSIPSLPLGAGICSGCDVRLVSPRVNQSVTGLDYFHADRYMGGSYVYLSCNMLMVKNVRGVRDGQL